MALSSSLSEGTSTFINLITGGISFVSCLWVLYFYIKTHRSGVVPLKFVLLLTVSDLVYAFTNILNYFDKTSDDLCLIEGILREASFISSCVWAISISILTYRVSSQPDFRQRLFFRRAAIVGLLIIGIFTLA